VEIDPHLWPEVVIIHDHNMFVGFEYIGGIEIVTDDKYQYAEVIGLARRWLMERTGFDRTKTLADSKRLRSR